METNNQSSDEKNIVKDCHSNEAGNNRYNHSNHHCHHGHHYHNEDGGKHSLIDKIFFSSLLICLGVSLISINMGWMDIAWKRVIISWQMLVTMFGVLSLCHKNYLFGSIVTIGGLLWLAATRLQPIFNIDEETWLHTLRLLIYSGIILIGIIALLKTLFGHPSKKRYFEEHYNQYSECEMNQNADGKINYQFMFSGTEQVFLEPEFKGGDIKTMFGGVNLDLRRTTLPAGTTHLNMDMLFGGISLIIPETWPVEIHRECFCGGFEDKRRIYNNCPSDRKLIIHAKCCFGGGDIQ